MELQRFIIQKSLVTETEPDLKQLIPVFHRWIQQQEIEGHLLIDVVTISTSGMPPACRWWRMRPH